MHARDAATGDLEPTGAIPVGTSPDNIELASDGSLWIAGHSRVFDFLAHAEDAKAVAPSHVQRVDPSSGRAEDILIDTAGLLSASSVGAPWEGPDGRPGGGDDTLLVGAVFDAHVLVCPLAPSASRDPR